MIHATIHFAAGRYTSAHWSAIGRHSHQPTNQLKLRLCKSGRVSACLVTESGREVERERRDLTRIRKNDRPDGWPVTRELPVDLGKKAVHSSYTHAGSVRFRPRDGIGLRGTVGPTDDTGTMPAPVALPSSAQATRRRLARRLRHDSESVFWPGCQCPSGLWPGLAGIEHAAATSLRLFLFPSNPAAT